MSNGPMYKGVRGRTVKVLSPLQKKLEYHTYMHKQNPTKDSASHLKWLKGEVNKEKTGQPTFLDKRNEEMNMNSTRQIIDAVLQDDPLVVRDTIATNIVEKIAAALDEKKVAVAQNIIGLGEQKDKSDGKDGPTKHPFFGGKSAHSKPPYHTKNEEIEIDFESFKAFLSDELEVELDDDDVEFLLEDMDQETFDQVVADYRMALNESKKFGLKDLGNGKSLVKKN